MTGQLILQAEHLLQDGNRWIVEVLDVETILNQMLGGATKTALLAQNREASVESDLISDFAELFVVLGVLFEYFNEAILWESKYDTILLADGTFGARLMGNELIFTENGFLLAFELSYQQGSVE